MFAIEHLLCVSGRYIVRMLPQSLDHYAQFMYFSLNPYFKL